MARLTVDTEELIVALDNHGSEHEYYLNLETGDVEIVFDEGISGETDEGLAQDMEEHPEKYRPIRPIPSFRSYNVMVDFVESLEDSKAKRRLSDALEGRKPFRNFKETLRYFPEIREDWFRFEEQAQKEFAREWLREEEIDAELRPMRHEKA